MAKFKWTEQCEVCKRLKIAHRDTMYSWTPAGEEARTGRYLEKVWIHRNCALRLEAGERPDGVLRFGPSKAQLMEIVIACETLGWTAWRPDEDPETPNGRRTAYRIHVNKMYKMIEYPTGHRNRATANKATDGLYTQARFMLLIKYLHDGDDRIVGPKSSRRLWGQPTDLVTKLREMNAAEELHLLQRKRRLSPYEQLLDIY